MRNGVPLIAAAITVLVVGAGAGIRLAVVADAARRARAREAAAAVAQYGLLFGFAAVAAAISAHGLVGFARSNMGLPGLWPYLLWGALDGAAGLCAVLLMRRAARGESALALRLAVWGLVAASSLFNWAHAPDHPGAREAFALMPVIAATLFEFSLRETRHTASGPERRLNGLGWLRPAERIRVRLQLSADEEVSAEAATRRVRADCAARAAGLARRSARGTLIDHFRDRIMLAIRDEHRTIAGFIGRAHPHAGPSVPKYLNSPETSAYTKGDLLFGLHEARSELARGAVLVIVEGPFDAMAISAAGPGRYAGLAPCGTALTSRQAAALGRVTDLHQAGVLVALDGDRAGREAAIKAYGVLLAVTSKLTAVILPAGSDPAEILQADGPDALRDVLRNQTKPLAAVVIDAHLDSWASQLDHPEGQLRAMRSAAGLIATLLPSETADQILQVTEGRHLAALNDALRPVANPELPAIARLLPANAACQIVRVANRTESDCSEVTAEVANAISLQAAVPKRAAARGRQINAAHGPRAPADPNPACLATAGFPGSANPVTNSTPNLKPRPCVPPIPREGGSRRPAHR